MLGPELPLDRIGAERLLRRAIHRAAGGSGLEGDLLWQEGGDALLLHLGRVRLATADRLAVVGVPIYSDQSGEAEVVIPFVTNAAADPVGLTAATESVPRGPRVVVDRFGEALVAVAWAGLVEMSAAWAAAAGARATGTALAPAGLAATRKGLTIVVQTPLTTRGSR